MIKIPPVKRTRRHKKVIVFGDAGTGKSYFSCTFPGPRAVFDFEHGCDYYVNDHSEGCPLIASTGECNCNGDFKLDSLNPNDTLRAINDIVSDNGKSVKSIIIDPVTVFQMQMTEAFGKEQMTASDWKPVKLPIQRMLVRMMNTPVHFCLSARLRDLEIRRMANGKAMPISVDKPHIWGDFLYAPDIILKMDRVEVEVSGTVIPGQYRWTATVLKNRLPGMRAGQRFESGINGVDPITFNTVFGEDTSDEELPLTQYDDPQEAALAASNEGAVNMNGAVLNDSEVSIHFEEIKRSIEGAQSLNDLNALKVTWNRYCNIKGRLTREQIDEITTMKDSAKSAITNKQDN